MEPEAPIINIIAKKLHGEATAEELSQLQSWLDADAGNPPEYAKLVKIWEQTHVVLSEPSFDTLAAWKKLDARINRQAINKNEIRPSGAIITLFRKRMTLAAAAVVFFVIGIFLWNKTYSKLQKLTAENGNLVVNLPDGSVVVLRKGSSLQYLAAFDTDERKVALTGEAFFDVHRNVQQPFLITTAHSTVKVLGTSFLVRSKEAMDEVVVASGKVLVTDKVKAGNHVLLIAGQKIVLQNDHFLETRVNDSNYIAWKSGLLDFKDASLVKVLEDVSHYYELPVGISGQNREAIEKIRITVRFEKQSLEQVLDEIKLITGLETKKENTKTFFYQK